MEYTTIFINTDDNKTHEVFIQSENASQSFSLHSNDVEFIESDILDNNARQGELEIIVDEGLILIDWQIVK